MTKHHLLNSVELNKYGASYFLKEKNIDSMAVLSIIKTFAISMPEPNNSGKSTIYYTMQKLIKSYA